MKFSEVANGALTDLMADEHDRGYAAGLAEGRRQWKERAQHLARLLDRIVGAWSANAHRIFETMGDDNPRVEAVDDAVEYAIAHRAEHLPAPAGDGESVFCIHHGTHHCPHHAGPAGEGEGSGG